jgi:chromosomal replication initiator protein
VAILRRKAETDDVHLPDDVALFIAHHVKSNIRELEGLLNRVVAFASMSGSPISLDLTKYTLRDILPQTNHVTATEITKFVARHYGLKVSEIKSPDRSRHIALPRQVAMYLLKQLTELSYPDIGRQFNKRHHSTVLHSVNKIEEERAKNPDFDRTIQGFIDHFS